jgi:hypothetical protein
MLCPTALESRRGLELPPTVVPEAIRNKYIMCNYLWFKDQEMYLFFLYYYIDLRMSSESTLYYETRIKGGYA